MAGTKINPSKGSSTAVKISTDNLQKRHNDIREICVLLSGETEFFSPQNTYEKIGKYLDVHKRWFYSDISNFLFASDEEKVGVFMSNLETLQGFAYEKAGPRETAAQASQQVVMIDKLWDHANLAQWQKTSFSTKEADIDERLDVKLKPKIDVLSKELSKELISLIAIFTALSFIIFGSISSLDNIFEGARSFPIIQVLIIGCVWGLCILNLVFAFVFFVSKLTQLPIASTDKKDANIVQKYPFWVYSNFLIAFLLALFGWLYLIDYTNSGGWLYICMQEHARCLLLGIVLAFVLAFLYLVRKSGNRSQSS